MLRLPKNALLNFPSNPDKSAKLYAVSLLKMDRIRKTYPW